MDFKIHSSYIAQLVERLTVNQNVPGSSPGIRAMCFNTIMLSTCMSALVQASSHVNRYCNAY